MKHDGGVNSAQFSADGQRVVTASGDQTARVWDAATGKALSEPMKHDGAVPSAQFSVDGPRVVTASDDQTARCGTSRQSRARIALTMQIYLLIWPNPLVVSLYGLLDKLKF
jgi:WD40 repeat protein